MPTIYRQLITGQQYQIECNFAADFSVVDPAVRVASHFGSIDTVLK